VAFCVLSWRHACRNFVKAEDADYTVLSEYSSFPQVTRARAVFFQRRRRLMLYTERAHFYHRYRIRGIQVCCRQQLQG
jgi:U3 small nucleolar RNA-associated protein 25